MPYLGGLAVASVGTLQGMRDEYDDLIEDEEEAAATEAAGIGGRSGMEGMDEAQRASAEHGGGEAEGFEEAEELLEEGATHGDPSGDPLEGLLGVEAEDDEAIHGEADEFESTETEVDTNGSRPRES